VNRGRSFFFGSENLIADVSRSRMIPAVIVGSTWRCLGHPFASRLLTAVMRLQTVQELMGHKTIAMTCWYAHPASQYQLGAVNRLDGWGRKPSSDSKTEAGKSRGAHAVPVETTQPILQ